MFSSTVIVTRNPYEWSRVRMRFRCLSTLVALDLAYEVNFKCLVKLKV